MMFTIRFFAPEIIVPGFLCASNRNNQIELLDNKNLLSVAGVKSTLVLIRVAAKSLHSAGSVSSFCPYRLQYSFSFPKLEKHEVLNTGSSIVAGKLKG